ncbi:hypothetical protein DPMN_081271 [Dreissena polymorpha]|uniref:Uncharacterized protein n=1 Tax=Dreissena polymorpha TaxID=45954 RepID=A0A9D4BG50_DREPO|nr:hypothetical protein DPMN_081271 [Dreissena polymorpha]
MISGNATLFIAASRELINLRYSTSVRDTPSNLGVKWRFIPQRAPWYGGWWASVLLDLLRPSKEDTRTCLHQPRVLTDDVHLQLTIQSPTKELVTLAKYGVLGFRDTVDVEACMIRL